MINGGGESQFHLVKVDVKILGDLGNTINTMYFICSWCIQDLTGVEQWSLYHTSAFGMNSTKIISYFSFNI